MLWEVKEKVKIWRKYRFCISALAWVCIKNKVFTLVKKTYNVINNNNNINNNLLRFKEQPLIFGDQKKKNDCPQIEKRFNYIDRKFKRPAFPIQRPPDNRDGGKGWNTH